MLGDKYFLRTFCFAVCVGLFILTTSASADITVSGDSGEVQPANPATWTTTATGNIGINNGKTGILTVAGGSTLLSNYGYFGGNAGSTGNVTVTGNGSTWTNNMYLYVGWYGTGNLTIANGGLVTSNSGTLGTTSSSTGTVNVTGAGSIWTNSGSLDVGHSGIGILTIANGGHVNSNGSSDFGFGSGSMGTGMGTVTVTGAGSSWTNSGTLEVGWFGVGNLTIANGGQVNGGGGELGCFSGATGAATVTGAGSTWTINALEVGYSGAGSLTITNGGQVSNSGTGILGYFTGSTGNVMVTGNGSTWTNDGTLYVGSQASVGNLVINNGGKVTAKTLSINSSSSINLKVSGNNMMVLGNNSTIGTITNNGTINLYANTFMSAGVYMPISDYAGRTLSWSGFGPNTFGGTWNSVADTFTVPADTPLAAGATGNLSTGERLLISGNSQQVGASFGSVVAGMTFSANLATAGEISSLQALLSANETVLSAWDYTTNLSGNTVLLSYSLQTGDSNLRVWHYNGSLWSLYPASDLVFDSSGVASFTVNSFSGYAITGVVPEPATLSLLALGSLALLCKRK